MNIGYLLFMGLLCTTLTLWAIVAIRDDGQGAVEDEELEQEPAAEETKPDEPAVEGEDDTAEPGE